MKKIFFDTSYKKMLADIFTPVGIYLRLRDKFRDSILLESTDFHASENSYSIIAINAIAGIELRDLDSIEYKLPGIPSQKIKLGADCDVPNLIFEFMNRFEVTEEITSAVKIAQGLFGYTSYDAVSFFEKILLNKNKDKGQKSNIPLMRYRLFQYVIIINHFKDELYLCENHFDGVDSKISDVESIIKNKDVPFFPFKAKGTETSNITDEAYEQMVNKAVECCLRGDTFQVVLSRSFLQSFTGDEFNVYRALRNINPGPYLFYFDYGDYKLFGSSPESQLIIENKKAILHPIAGTVKRSTNDEMDKILALQLENDPKENAEHTMLVDLARNDLSKLCSEVEVSEFKKINYYSHVIHLVSKVQGKITNEINPFKILAATFPAGTLSGAPKYRAMQLIDEYENISRGFYGGAIGYIGFDGSCNHAIMIRTFQSINNTLISQAGAGIVAESKSNNELQEVNNKLVALKQAIDQAQTITH